MKRTLYYLIHSVLLSAIVFSLPLWVQADPVILPQAPPVADEGQPIVVSANVTETTGDTIRRVTLYARTTGTLGYWSVPMRARGNIFTATIPKKIVLLEGVEYYIAATTSKGIQKTSPALSATVAPHRIQIRGQSGGPVLELLSPEAGERVAPEEVVIVVGIDSGKKQVDLSTLKFYFDEKDVTENVNATSTMLSYVAPESLSDGLHGFWVEIKDNEGNKGRSPTWSVAISRDPKVKKVLKAVKPAFKVKGTAGLQSQLSILHDEPNSITALAQPEGFINRFNLALYGEAGDWNFRTTANLTSEETPGQQPVNRFQLNVFNDYLDLKLGDVYPLFSTYSLNTLFIRGAHLTLISGEREKSYSQLQVTAGNSKIPVEGRSPDYGATFEQWVIGSRYDYEFLPGSGFSLNYTTVNEYSDSVEDTGNAAPLSNHVLTGEGKLKFFFMPKFTMALFGEYGVDYYDEAHSLFQVSIGDAYRFGNRWEWQGNSFVQVEYFHTGANYTSVANPFLITDYEGIVADGQLNFLNDDLSILGKVESWKDNLDGQKNLTNFDTVVDPVGVTVTSKGTKTTNVYGSISYRLAPYFQNIYFRTTYNGQLDDSDPIHYVNYALTVFDFGTTVQLPVGEDQLLTTLTYSLTSMKNNADYKIAGEYNGGAFNASMQYGLGRLITFTGAFGYAQTFDDVSDVQGSSFAYTERVLDQTSLSLRADWNIIASRLALTGEWTSLMNKDDIESIDSQTMSMALGSTYYLPYNQRLMLTLSNISFADQLDESTNYGEFIIDFRYGITF